MLQCQTWTVHILDLDDLVANLPKILPTEIPELHIVHIIKGARNWFHRIPCSWLSRKIIIFTVRVATNSIVESIIYTLQYWWQRLFPRESKMAQARQISWSSSFSIRTCDMRSHQWMARSGNIWQHTGILRDGRYPWGPWIWKSFDRKIGQLSSGRKIQSVPSGVVLGNAWKDPRYWGNWMKIQRADIALPHVIGSYPFNDMVPKSAQKAAYMEEENFVAREVLEDPF